MNQEIRKIVSIMDEIEYGYKNEDGVDIVEANPNGWSKFYKLQTPDELLESKCGICWDQVELERKLFEDKKISFKTYFIYIVDDDMLPSHTFLVYQKSGKYYWFENSWEIYKGIHEYSTELDLLLDVKDKFAKQYNYVSEMHLYIYEYERPREHISSDEFYRYIETQKLIKTNKPLYFYHLVNKDADMSNGLISLQYMYEHNLFAMFDKNILKYKERIVGNWDIKKYKNRDTLTREEYIDALNIYRGIYGANYIYFFRFPPYKKLGKKIFELSKFKDIYRINLNDEGLQKNMVDIFYGFDMSNSDNKILDKKYYENVTKKEYFSKYDDSIYVNFSTLNHIGISFKNGNCPLEFLEKVDWE